MGGITKEIHNLAKIMHDEYEYQSIKSGWKTQDKCKVAFDALPKENQEVMFAVAHRVAIYFKNRIDAEFMNF